MKDASGAGRFLITVYSNTVAEPEIKVYDLDSFEKNGTRHPVPIKMSAHLRPAAFSGKYMAAFPVDGHHSTGKLVVTDLSANTPAQQFTVCEYDRNSAEFFEVAIENDTVRLFITK
jgi:hypothetical protein